MECDTCDRWQHYNCEKLTDAEVKFIETSKDYIYSCKFCKNFSSDNHKLMLPAPFRSSENTVPKTLTESILSDETNSDCALCCEPLNDDEVSCEKCGSICHFFCMSPLNSDICQACAATDAIFTQQSQEQNSQSQDESLLNSPHIASQDNLESVLKPPLRFNQSDENEKLANEIKQRESDLSAKQKGLRQR